MKHRKKTSLRPAAPTGKEQTFGKDEIIVSKTDTKGIITYANDVFVRVAGYSEEELVGRPHNLIRHPAMPRCIFRFLWDTLKDGREIFAYVVNLARDGSHYWVFAHVTPSFDTSDNIIGYHSNRRLPRRDALEKIIPIYEALLSEEKKHPLPEDAIRAGMALLHNTLSKAGVTYEEFIFTL